MKRLAVMLSLVCATSPLHAQEAEGDTRKDFATFMERVRSARAAPGAPETWNSESLTAFLTNSHWQCVEPGTSSSDRGWWLTFNRRTIDKSWGVKHPDWKVTGDRTVVVDESGSPIIYEISQDGWFLRRIEGSTDPYDLLLVIPQ